MPSTAGRRDSIVLRFLAAPTDVAATGGTVQAGRVLEWIDKAGYACAVGWSGENCVTAYVGNVRFNRRIPAGSLVEVHAKLLYTGRSSMHILVTVLAADPRAAHYEKATECILVFVAVGQDGASAQVPSWVPGTESEVRLQAAARDRVPLRAEIKAEMARQEWTGAGSAPHMTFRFLSAPTDVNWSGRTHGGTVMAWIDETAYACAAGWSKAHAVAVYAGGIHFHRPIPIGHILEIEARLLMTGRTSMHIGLRVRSGDPRNPVMELSAQCLSVFVALDDDGRPLEVPTYVPATEEDIRLNEHAAKLTTMRNAMPSLDFSDLEYLPGEVPAAAAPLPRTRS